MCCCGDRRGLLRVKHVTGLGVLVEMTNSVSKIEVVTVVAADWKRLFWCCGDMVLVVFTLSFVILCFLVCEIGRAHV